MNLEFRQRIIMKSIETKESKTQLLQMKVMATLASNLGRVLYLIWSAGQLFRDQYINWPALVIYLRGWSVIYWSSYKNDSFQ